MKDKPCPCGSHHFWSHDGQTYYCSQCKPMQRSAQYTRTIGGLSEQPPAPYNKQDWFKVLGKACEQLSIDPGQLDALVHEDEKASAGMNVPQLVAFAKSYLRHGKVPESVAVNSWRDNRE